MLVVNLLGGGGNVSCSEELVFSEAYAFKAISLWLKNSIFGNIRRAFIIYLANVGTFLVFKNGHS
jgi:hypothetical protein